MDFIRDAEYLLNKADELLGEEIKGAKTCRPSKDTYLESEDCVHIYSGLEEMAKAVGETIFTPVYRLPYKYFNKTMAASNIKAFLWNGILFYEVIKESEGEKDDDISD